MEEEAGDRDYSQNTWMQQKTRGSGSAGVAGLGRDPGLGCPHPQSSTTRQHGGGRRWRNEIAVMEVANWGRWPSGLIAVWRFWPHSAPTSQGAP